MPRLLLLLLLLLPPLARSQGTMAKLMSCSSSSASNQRLDLSGTDLP